MFGASASLHTHHLPESQPTAVLQSLNNPRCHFGLFFTLRAHSKIKRPRERLPLMLPKSTQESGKSWPSLYIKKAYPHSHNRLPAFYVVVNFIKMPENTAWVGGEAVSKERPFIRLAIEHIAVHAPNEDEAYRRTANRVDAAIKPHIADKGYDWEFHIDETERRLWRINGLYPPPFQSEEEKVWSRENRAVPFEQGNI